MPRNQLHTQIIARDVVIANLHAVYVEDEARLALERDYLAGHASLFPDVAAAWLDAVEMAERVARFALFWDDDEVDEEGEFRPLRDYDLAPYRAAAAAQGGPRAEYLADMARARVLDMCQEEERALRTLARHFGPGEAGEPSDQSVG